MQKWNVEVEVCNVHSQLQLIVVNRVQNAKIEFQFPSESFDTINHPIMHKRWEFWILKYFYRSRNLNF